MVGSTWGKAEVTGRIFWPRKWPKIQLIIHHLSNRVGASGGKGGTATQIYTGGHLPANNFWQWQAVRCMLNSQGRSISCVAHSTAAQLYWQSWALSIFFSFFNNKKLFFCIFYKVNNLFLHQSYLKTHSQ